MFLASKIYKQELNNNIRYKIILNKNKIIKLNKYKIIKLNKYKIIKLKNT